MFLSNSTHNYIKPCIHGDSKPSLCRWRTPADRSHISIEMQDRMHILAIDLDFTLCA